MSEKIKITNNYLESLIDQQTNKLSYEVEKLIEIPLPAKPQYWITKAFDEIVSNINVYLQTKRKILLE